MTVSARPPPPSNGARASGMDDRRDGAAPGALRRKASGDRTTTGGPAAVPGLVEAGEGGRGRARWMGSRRDGRRAASGGARGACRGMAARRTSGELNITSSSESSAAAAAGATRPRAADVTRRFEAGPTSSPLDEDAERGRGRGTAPLGATALLPPPRLLPTTPPLDHSGFDDARPDELDVAAERRRRRAAGGMMARRFLFEGASSRFLRE